MLNDPRTKDLLAQLESGPKLLAELVVLSALHPRVPVGREARRLFVDSLVKSGIVKKLSSSPVIVALPQSSTTALDPSSLPREQREALGELIDSLVNFGGSSLQTALTLALTPDSDWRPENAEQASRLRRAAKSFARLSAFIEGMATLAPESSETTEEGLVA